MHAELGDVLHGVLDGVVDVEQLDVEKDLLALADEPLGEGEAAGEAELQANLVEGDGVAERRDHFLGRLDGGHVEADDQAVANVEQGHGRASWFGRGAACRMNSRAMARKAMAGGVFLAVEATPRRPSRSGGSPGRRGDQCARL